MTISPLFRETPTAEKEFSKRLCSAERLHILPCLAKAHSGCFLLYRFGRPTKSCSYLSCGVGREKAFEQIDFPFRPKTFYELFPLCSFFLLCHLVLPFVKWYSVKFVPLSWRWNHLIIYEGFLKVSRFFANFKVGNVTNLVPGWAGVLPR